MRLVKLYILIFFIYSFAGWCVEVIDTFIREKKYVNRGFLVGPLCSIYGFGVVAINVLLYKYQEDLLIMFIMSMVICGVLEYGTSYFLEKIFNARWWDYSHLKFNLNGRVCLKNLILFGIAGCVVSLVNPHIIEHLSNFSDLTINILVYSLLAIYILDFFVSCKIIMNLKILSGEIKDNTKEITEKVKEIIYNKSELYRRVVDAFPAIKGKVKYQNWKIKKKIKKEIRKLTKKNVKK